jgi:hypothetical protein
MDFDYLMRRFEAAKVARANWETLWQQIADRVLPQAADFTSKRTDGERRTSLMYDATAALAARNAVAAISTFCWPSNQTYQKLTTSDDSLNQSQRVKVAMDEWTKRLFAARYSPRAAFEAQMGEAALQFFVFGTGVLFIDDNVHDVLAKRAQGFSLRYKSLHLAQTYLLENDSGVVDTLFRCWPWTLRQLNQRFPGKLPEKLQKRLQTHPDDKVDVVQCVMPRTDYQRGQLGYRGMPWASCYFLPAEKHSLEEGGFRSWPFMVMRYMTSPGEIYGRSPAWLALSDIKVLNSQKRSILQAAQLVADPPLLLSEDGVLGAFSMAPGALNFGGLDPNGNQLVKPLITGADVRIGMEMMDKEREIISSAFLLDVFRALVENPQMTATQALEIMQERATLMSPIIGRIESEGFSPGTERELDLLANANQLPPPPPEMIEAQGEYKIEYTSPARRAMRASEAIAITRTLEAVIPMAQADPSVLDVIDMQAAAREVAEINGVPAKILRDPDQIKAMAEDRANQQQMASLVEAAPQVSAAAANLTKMQANAGRATL